MFALFVLITIPAVAAAQYDYPTGGGGATMGGPPPAMDDPGGMTMPDMNMPHISGGAGVSIVDFAFQPSLISVPVGTTVTWTNSGAAPHTVTSNGGPFDSGAIGPGGNFSATFSAPGTYMYHCSIHPNMTGAVQVSGS